MKRVFPTASGKLSLDLYLWPQDDYFYTIFPSSFSVGSATADLHLYADAHLVGTGPREQPQQAAIIPHLCQSDSEEDSDSSSSEELSDIADNVYGMARHKHFSKMRRKPVGKRRGRAKPRRVAVKSAKKAGKAEAQSRRAAAQPRRGKKGVDNRKTVDPQELERQKFEETQSRIKKLEMELKLLRYDPNAPKADNEDGSDEDGDTVEMQYLMQRIRKLEEEKQQQSAAVPVTAPVQSAAADLLQQQQGELNRLKHNYAYRLGLEHAERQRAEEELAMLRGQVRTARSMDFIRQGVQQSSALHDDRSAQRLDA